MCTSSTEESGGWKTEVVGTRDACRGRIFPVLRVTEGLPRPSREVLHHHSHPYLAELEVRGGDKPQEAWLGYPASFAGN